MPYVGNRFKASALPATIVSTDKSNLFTLPQKIKNTAATLFTLYRNGTSTNGTVAGLDITLDNLAAAEKIYAQYLGVIEDSTTSSEKGSLIMRILHTGALRNALKINNDGSIEWGTPTTPFGKFAATGLSALRTFTFPNADAQLAGVNVANTFTLAQKISVNAANLFTLHRPSNVSGLTVSYDLNDSAGTEKTFARIDVTANDSTAGSEDALFILRLMTGGVLSAALSLDETGLVKLGIPGVQRIRLDCATGLLAIRTFTFPDVSTQLVGLTGVATLSNKILDATCDVSAAVAGGGGGSGGAIAPIASYIIRKDLTEYVAVDMSTNIEMYHNASFYTVFNSVHTAMVTAGRGKIILGPGDFSTTTKPVITADNLTIEGCGVDVTRIVLDSAATGTALQLGVRNTGLTIHALTVDADKGQKVITAASTTGVVAGDWIQLTREVFVDFISTTRFDAEIHKVISIDSGTQLTIDTDLYADYNVANNAGYVVIPMTYFQTLKDMTIYDNRNSVASAGDGAIYCVYQYGFHIDNVKFERGAHECLHIESCFNTTLDDVYLETPTEVVDAPGLNYGLYVTGSTTNLSWNGGWAHNCRHSITNNSNTGIYYKYGRQRNVTLNGITSYNSNTAHFDLHQAGLGWTFNGCVALGGYHSAVTTDVQAFNLRSPATLNGCIMQCASNQAMVIWIDGDGVGNDTTPGGSRTVINGCQIMSTLTADTDPDTQGIVINPNRTSVIINACQFFDLNSHAIIIEDPASDVIISNNMFHSIGEDLTSAQGIIQCNGDIDRLNITNNNMSAGTPSPAGRPLVVVGTVNHLLFEGNDISQLTNRMPTIPTGSTDVWIEKNPGLNPINKVTNFANNTNDTLGCYGGTTATVVASNDYTVVGGDIILTSTGGTGVSITLKDGAGNTIVGSLTTLAAQSIPKGYIVNFGAFSVAPTVAVYAR